MMNETILIVTTAAALGLAIAMALVLWLLLREERRRSNARAALLADMAADARADTPDDFADDLRINEPIGDFEVIHATDADMFAAAPARSPWPQRIAIAGVLAAVLGGITLAARAWAPRHVPAVTAAAPAASQPALLELLSLRHTQQAESLTITGLVQNPRQGAPIEKITATAMLFAADGTFIATRRTPLDLTTLRPGDESGFVITVPVAGGVARYRIGFRAEDGRIIGHVDRRDSPSIARGPS
jgi:hypothetical protein